jgi:hypothetical protein
LESIGIATAFLSAPAHILLLFDTGISSKNQLLLGISKEFVVVDDRIFLPVETTEENFYYALKAGEEQLSLWKDKAEVILTEESWKSYLPFGLPSEDIEVLPPERNKVSEMAEESIKLFFSEREDSFRKEIEREENLNRLEGGRKPNKPWKPLIAKE